VAKSSWSSASLAARRLFWSALHEVALDILLAEKGEEHAARYLAALEEHAKRAFQQPHACLIQAQNLETRSIRDHGRKSEITSKEK
jgi:hypothetical protein